MPGTLNVGGHDIITHSGDAGAGDVTVNVQNRLVLDSSGNVGVGTNSPDAKLTILDTATFFKIYQDSTNEMMLTVGSGERMLFGINGTEAMRIDSSGNVGVGTNSPGYTLEVQPPGTSGAFRVSASGYSNQILINDGQLTRQGATFVPSVDNSYDLGASSLKWDDVYATNGTIQTSDRNEKQDIEELSEAEQRVAVAAKSLMRKFRWKSAVAKKGDEARIHFGIIAQDLQAAFEAEGLDAGRYAMFISSTWWETSETYTDDEGIEQTRTKTYETAEEAPEGAVERTRLGVRYSELLAFIIAAI